MRNGKFLSICIIGTILEWYDFGLLGSLAPIISHLFFPASSQFLSLLVTLAVFATGFVMRPIGAILFGIIGDKYGRRKALIISIAYMALPTTIIACLPTYQSIGMAAGIILVVLRLLQGLSASGEYAGAITLLVENSPAKQKLFGSSLSLVGVTLGYFFGYLVGFISVSLVTGANAWRLPFIFGSLLSLIGIYMRSNLSESVAFIELYNKRELSKNPIKECLTHHSLELLLAIGLFAFGAVTFYIGFVYIPSFILKMHKITINDLFKINSMNILLLAMLIPSFAVIFKKTNVLNVMLISSLLSILFAYPFFILCLSGRENYLALGQLIFIGLIASFVYAVPYISAKLFPAHLRFTGISISTNVAGVIFGGLAPVCAAVITQKSGNPCLPGVYLALCILISFMSVATILIRDRALNADYLTA